MTYTGKIGLILLTVTIVCTSFNFVKYRVPSIVGIWKDKRTRAAITFSVDSFFFVGDSIPEMADRIRWQLKGDTIITNQPIDQVGTVQRFSKIIKLTQYKLVDELIRAQFVTDTSILPLKTYSLSPEEYIRVK